MVKNLPAYVGDVGSIPGLGRNLGKGNGNLLQYSCLKNWMDKGVWWAIAHGVTKSWTQLSNWAHTHTTHCMELHHTTNAPTFSYTFSLCWRTFRVFRTFHYNKYAVVNTLNAHLLYMGEVLCGKISSIEMSGWRTWMLQFGFLSAEFSLKSLHQLYHFRTYLNAIFQVFTSSGDYKSLQFCHSDGQREKILLSF